LNWISSFLEALLQVALDRMMFSADHPHQSMTECTTFLAIYHSRRMTVSASRTATPNGC
jgi:predicted TIM-barrel fold metal-dependent hydrolase